MFIEERYEAILDLLNTNGKVSVKGLSDMFEVSESMTRKDLQTLEKRGMLKRTYGGAIPIKKKLTGEERFKQRLQLNREAKEMIAQKSFDIIEERDTIFLDVSSTSYLLAELIVQSQKHLTVITNMPAIAAMISATSSQNFMFIGGDYNPVVGGNIGSHAIEQINEIRCSKSFIGCNGADLLDGGLSVSNSEDAHTKKAIIKITKQPYLLLPYSYLERYGLHTYANLQDFTGLITNELPDDGFSDISAQFDIAII